VAGTRRARRRRLKPGAAAGTWCPQAPQVLRRGSPPPGPGIRGRAATGDPAGCGSEPPLTGPLPQPAACPPVGAVPPSRLPGPRQRGAAL